MQEDNDKLFVQRLVSNLSNVKIQNPFKPIRRSMFVTSDSININAIENVYGYLYKDRDITTSQ